MSKKRFTQSRFYRRRSDVFFFFLQRLSLDNWLQSPEQKRAIELLNARIYDLGRSDDAHEREELLDDIHTLVNFSSFLSGKYD